MCGPPASSSRSLCGFIRRSPATSKSLPGIVAEKRAPGRMETVPCQVYMGMTDEEARTVFTPLTWANAPNCCPVNGLRATRRWPGRYAWKAAGGGCGRTGWFRGQAHGVSVYAVEQSGKAPTGQSGQERDLRICRCCPRRPVGNGAANLLAVLEQHDQTGITEKAAKEVVALSRYDVEAIERCLFPVREKEHRPRAAVRAS